LESVLAGGKVTAAYSCDRIVTAFVFWRKDANGDNGGAALVFKSSTFLRRNSPQNRILFQVGFNLQTAEIQTAIGVQSDSKQHAIGFKTANQKIAKFF
jgi:hypothetical protein